MKRHTKSILEELTAFGSSYDKEHIIENKADNIIAGVQNLLDLINETYDEDISADLKKRLINSIKSNDPAKFKRGLKKTHASKRHSGGKQA